MKVAVITIEFFMNKFDRKTMNIVEKFSYENYLIESQKVCSLKVSTKIGSIKVMKCTSFMLTMTITVMRAVMSTNSI